MRSVLNQDYDDLELIVVDDASSDGSAEVVASFGDERVRYIRLDRPGGAPAARNHGIAHASGRLIAFQDSDDEWCDGHLRLLVAALLGSTEAVVAYGAVRRPPSEGATLIPGPADQVRAGDLRPVSTRYNLVNLPSSVVLSEALAASGGFDERFRRYQDWDLFLTLAGVGAFVYVDAVVTIAGDAPRRITQDTDAEVAALALILDKHAPLFAMAPDLEIAQWARLTRLLLRSRRLGAAAAQAARVCARPRDAARWLRSEVTAKSSPLDRDRLGVAR
jgi:glycosyltransferase involved in cell wall biosynthesis